MRQQYEEIQAKGAEVVAISFEPRDRLFRLTHLLQLPFTILSDPERDVYAAYGLAQGTWLKIFSPKTVWTYVKHFARGRRYHHAAGDWRQFGRGLCPWEGRDGAVRVPGAGAPRPAIGGQPDRGVGRLVGYSIDSPRPLDGA